jgi:ribosomal protein L37E
MSGVCYTLCYESGKYSYTIKRDEILIVGFNNYTRPTNYDWYENDISRRENMWKKVYLGTFDF